MFCCSKDEKLVLTKVKITFSFVWCLLALLCVLIGIVFGLYVGLAVFVGLVLINKLKLIEIKVKKQNAKNDRFSHANFL